MKRANWKFNNIDLKAISKRKTKENHRTHISRNSVIVPIFLNKTFQVHNGKKNIEITVTEKMLGHKFGEFSFTRKNSKLKKKVKWIIKQTIGNLSI